MSPADAAHCCALLSSRAVPPPLPSPPPAHLASLPANAAHRRFFAGCARWRARAPLPQHVAAAGAPAHILPALLQRMRGTRGARNAARACGILLARLPRRTSATTTLLRTARSAVPACCVCLLYLPYCARLPLRASTRICLLFYARALVNITPYFTCGAAALLPNRLHCNAFINIKLWWGSRVRGFSDFVACFQFLVCDPENRVGKA